MLLPLKLLLADAVLAACLLTVPLLRRTPSLKG